MPNAGTSLKTKLALGAAMLGLVALLAAGMTVYATDSLTARIDANIAAERRIDRYSILSTQAGRFIVVATEAVQSGLEPGERASRLSSLTGDIENTFARLRRDLEIAVEEARALGLDEQSRRATQSLGIARMEAQLDSTRRALLSPEIGREQLQGHIDSFAIGFDPLLNAMITEEIRARDKIIAGVGDLRRSLTLMALAVSIATVVLLAAFYLGLVRPQFRRLDLLKSAAQRIGRTDFAIALPEETRDEIGGIFAETNRMAGALARRQDEVAQEWARLNETIADRTEELRAANAALAKTDEDRRRFFADISHELRTPLTVILMEAQLALKGSPDQNAAFRTIESRALRLNRRIDDLLRIARSETGQLELQTAPFDLADVARGAIADTQSELDSAGVAATCNLPETLMAKGDRNWIRQVITGVIQNAIRHARSGALIGLFSHESDDMVCVEVVDNGPGIAPRDQPGIFERFSQGDSAAKSEGFGIGLALAQWVLEKQGGRIGLMSPVDETRRLGHAPGTKVTLCIPRADD